MDPQIADQEPTTPLVIDHGDTRTVDQGQQPVAEGLSELEQYKRDRGYVKTEAPPVETPKPEAPEPPKAAKPEDKKDDRWKDPDTGDTYDMRHRVARRVKTLLEERGRERGRADKAEAEIARLTQALIERGNTPAQAERKAEQIVNDDPEPDPANAEKYPEGQFDKAFIKDMGRWAARQETQTQFDTRGAAAREQHEKAAFNAQVDQWNKQALPEARKRYADFDDVLAAVPTDAEVTHVMFNSPVGNDVVYILGTNAHVQRAYGMARTERDRYRVLYHVEAQLIQAQRSAAAKTKTATTNAPPPTDPVNTAAGAAQGVDWSKDDPDQYQRWKSQRSSRR